MLKNLKSKVMIHSEDRSKMNDNNNNMITFNRFNNQDEIINCQNQVAFIPNTISMIPIDYQNLFCHQNKPLINNNNKSNTINKWNNNMKKKNEQSIINMERISSSRPLCRCRVIYLGSSVPHKTKNGLHGIQEPLKSLYPEERFQYGENYILNQLEESISNGNSNSNNNKNNNYNTIDISHLSSSLGIDSWLSVWSNGILLENIDESGREIKRFFTIESLHYCAAVRFFDTKTLGNLNIEQEEEEECSIKTQKVNLIDDNNNDNSNQNKQMSGGKEIDNNNNNNKLINENIKSKRLSQDEEIKRKSSIKFLPLDAPLFQCPGMMDTKHPPVFSAILRRTSGIKVLECHSFICRRDAAANALVRCCTHAYATNIANRHRGPASVQLFNGNGSAFVGEALGAGSNTLRSFGYGHNINNNTDSCCTETRRPVSSLSGPKGGSGRSRQSRSMRSSVLVRRQQSDDEDENDEEEDNDDDDHDDVEGINEQNTRALSRRKLLKCLPNENNINATDLSSSGDDNYAIISKANIGAQDSQLINDYLDTTNGLSKKKNKNKRTNKKGSSKSLFDNFQPNESSSQNLNVDDINNSYQLASHSLDFIGENKEKQDRRFKSNQVSSGERNNIEHNNYDTKLNDNLLDKRHSRSMQNLRQINSLKDSSIYACCSSLNNGNNNNNNDNDNNNNIDCDQNSNCGKKSSSRRHYRHKNKSNTNKSSSYCRSASCHDIIQTTNNNKVNDDDDMIIIKSQQKHLRIPLKGSVVNMNCNNDYEELMNVPIVTTTTNTFKSKSRSQRSLSNNNNINRNVSISRLSANNYIGHPIIGSKHIQANFVKSRPPLLISQIEPNTQASHQCNIYAASNQVPVNHSQVYTRPQPQYSGPICAPQSQSLVLPPSSSSSSLGTGPIYMQANNSGSSSSNNNNINIGQHHLHPGLTLSLQPNGSNYIEHHQASNGGYYQTPGLSLYQAPLVHPAVPYIQVNAHSMYAHPSSHPHPNQHQHPQAQAQAQAHPHPHPHQHQQQPPLSFARYPPSAFINSAAFRLGPGSSATIAAQRRRPASGNKNKQTALYSQEKQTSYEYDLAARFRCLSPPATLLATAVQPYQASEKKSNCNTRQVKANESEQKTSAAAAATATKTSLQVNRQAPPSDAGSSPIDPRALGSIVTEPPPFLPPVPLSQQHEQQTSLPNKVQQSDERQHNSMLAESGKKLSWLKRISLTLSNASLESSSSNTNIRLEPSGLGNKKENCDRGRNSTNLLEGTATATATATATSTGTTTTTQTLSSKGTQIEANGIENRENEIEATKVKRTKRSSLLFAGSLTLGRRSKKNSSKAKKNNNKKLDEESQQKFSQRIDQSELESHFELNNNNNNNNIINISNNNINDDKPVPRKETEERVTNQDN